MAVLDILWSLVTHTHSTVIYHIFYLRQKNFGALHVQGSLVVCKILCSRDALGLNTEQSSQQAKRGAQR